MALIVFVILVVILTGRLSIERGAARATDRDNERRFYSRSGWERESCVGSYSSIKEYTSEEFMDMYHKLIDEVGLKEMLNWPNDLIIRYVEGAVIAQKKGKLRDSRLAVNGHWISSRDISDETW